MSDDDRNGCTLQLIALFLFFIMIAQCSRK
jgi:hypothetical protein